MFMLDISIVHGGMVDINQHEVYLLLVHGGMVDISYNSLEL